MRVARSDARTRTSWKDRIRLRKEIGIPRCSLSAFPDFLPMCVRDLEEDHAVTMAKEMRRVDVHVDGCKVPSSFVPPIESVEKGRKPLVMLHGFDSSCLEFRRLRPRLMERGIEAWAVDLLGWGFTDPSSCIYGSKEGSGGEYLLGCGPETKTKHLYAFWKQQLDSRPMVLLGASLGGAAALHFTLEHPDAVEALVLVDAQGFIEGIGPMSSLPTPIARLGLQVLKSVPLRDAANRMTYFDKEKFATQEARNIGRLHCLLPHWEDASLSFMQSGGYKVQKRIKLVEQSTLVLWGEQDKILEPDYALQFGSTLPNARIQWIKESGHVPHLEQPDAIAIAIEDFLNSL